MATEVNLKSPRLNQILQPFDPQVINTSIHVEVQSVISQYNADVGTTSEVEVTPDEPETENQNSLQDDKRENPKAQRSPTPIRKSRKEAVEP